MPNVILNIDPRVVFASIALNLRQQATYFDQLADGTVTRSITDQGIPPEQIATMKAAPAPAPLATAADGEPVKRKPGRPMKPIAPMAEPEAAPVAAPVTEPVERTVFDAAPAPRVVIAKPDVTPELLLSEIKIKLTALVHKSHAKAVAILAGIGVRKVSDIPADRYAEVLLAVLAALNPDADADPLA